MQRDSGGCRNDSGGCRNDSGRCRNDSGRCGNDSRSRGGGSGLDTMILCEERSFRQHGDSRFLVVLHLGQFRVFANRTSWTYNFSGEIGQPSMIEEVVKAVGVDSTMRVMIFAHLPVCENLVTHGLMLVK